MQEFFMQFYVFSENASSLNIYTESSYLYILTILFFRSSVVSLTIILHSNGKFSIQHLKYFTHKVLIFVKIRNNAQNLQIRYKRKYSINF